MWLALSSIVLGTAIGSNVLALSLTGSFKVASRQSPLTPSGTLHSEPSQPEMVLRQCRTRASCRALWSGRHGTNTERKPGTDAGLPVLALYADQTDAYIRGEHYHAGYQQSIVTVSGHSCARSLAPVGATPAPCRTTAPGVRVIPSRRRAAGTPARAADTRTLCLHPSRHPPARVRNAELG